MYLPVEALALPCPAWPVGTGNGQFQSTNDVTVDPRSGNLFVVSHHRCCAQEGPKWGEWACRASTLADWRSGMGAPCDTTASARGKTRVAVQNVGEPCEACAGLSTNACRQQHLQLAPRPHNHSLHGSRTLPASVCLSRTVARRDVDDHRCQIFTADGAYLANFLVDGGPPITPHYVAVRSEQSGYTQVFLTNTNSRAFVFAKSVNSGAGAKWWWWRAVGSWRVLLSSTRRRWQSTVGLWRVPVEDEVAG